MTTGLIAVPLELHHLAVPLLSPPKGHGPPCEPLNANWRLHWTVKAERVRLVREAIAWEARRCHLGRCKGIAVALVYYPGDNRRRDVDNLVPTLKAAADGLVPLVVADDTPAFMDKAMPRIVPLADAPGVTARRLVLTVEVITR